MTDPTIMALIARWREAAFWEHLGIVNTQYAAALDQCADELEDVSQVKPSEQKQDTTTPVLWARHTQKAFSTYRMFIDSVRRGEYAIVVGPEYVVLSKNKYDELIGAVSPVSGRKPTNVNAEETRPHRSVRENRETG